LSRADKKSLSAEKDDCQRPSLLVFTGKTSLKMKAAKYWFLLLLLLMAALSSQAQFRYGYFSIGVSGGTTNYLGDLDDDLTFRFTKGGFGADVKYRFNPFMSARLGFFHGWARAADSVSNNTARNRRNLHFRTPITDINAVLVFDFIPNDRRHNYRPPYVPYVFGGVSVFRFNPQALYRGQWVDLQSLGTEGQQTGLSQYPEPYGLVQFAIPMGAGVRFALTDLIDLEVETGFRKTFTDYLDDVSGEYVERGTLGYEQMQNNPTSIALMDRIDPVEYPDGAAVVNGIRGDNTQTDWYIFTCVRLNLILDWVRCPQF
jgi:hypothetical protein